MSATATGSLSVSGSLNEAPSEPPPEDVDTHLHETPSYVSDVDRLYVEITSDGDHAEVLRTSATSGLAATPYVVAAQDGADLELHVEAAALSTHDCKVKIFVMRLPQHDLLAIADGGAQMTGRTTADACLSAVGGAIVRQKLPPFFQRQLEAKQ